MTGRRIAIGDIHGCDVAFARVLAEIQPTAEDLVITLGDYVDRGPNSRRVIEQLLDLQQTARTVHLLGNHEIMMLSALDFPAENAFWLRAGGADTLASYNDSLAEIPKSHVDFLRGCVTFHELEDYFFVHANYTSELPLEKQPDYTLFWEHLTVHLPAPHVSGKKAIVGHTPQRDGNVFAMPHLICLDTYCYGGKYLTALDLDSGTIWQADNRGQLR
jgi:serine/threonine protein phosphatase 1